MLDRLDRLDNQAGIRVGGHSGTIPTKKANIVLVIDNWEVDKLHVYYRSCSEQCECFIMAESMNGIIFTIYYDL